MEGTGEIQSTDQQHPLDEKPVDLSEIANILFHDLKFTNGNNDKEDQFHIYPELILQQSEHGNKYYSSFQSHSKQFMTGDQLSNNKILRWSDSTIEQTQKLILDHWGSNNDIKEGNNNNKQKPSTTTTGSLRANALFSWSSSDAYIEARKKELRRLKGDSNIKRHDLSKSSNGHIADTEEDNKKTKLQESLNIAFPKQSINNKLNRIVEAESNKFIHARIQRIKKHHNDEMSKQIHERKRRDHEEYLRKLKIKEEEYEKSIQAAIEANQNKPGFFGSLFGFNPTSASASSSQVNTWKIGELENTNMARASSESVHTADSSSVAPSSSKSKKGFSLFGVFASSSPKRDRSKSTLFEKDRPVDALDTENKPSLSIENPAKNSSEAPEILITGSELDKHFSVSPRGSKDEEKHIDHDDDDDDDIFSEFETVSPKPAELKIVQSPKLSHNFLALKDGKVQQANDDLLLNLDGLKEKKNETSLLDL